ncbi:MAG TPA: ATP-binding protein, partial [Azonexus sp.]
GDAPQLLTTLVDLSERKLREEQLWRDRSFLREVIDSNPCLIFVKDGEGRFTLANQHLAELYGTTPRELIGKTDADFKRPPEEVEALLRADRAVIASRQEVVVGEEKLTDVHGRQYLFHTIKRPIADRDGKGTLVLGVGTDITARKQRELEIERQRNELAHLSRVTMLSELSGSLAHELNQPLAAILANAQAAQRFLAQEPPNLAEIGEILHDIVEDDRHAGGVIQGLRLLLKKGETRQEPLDLNEIVQAVLKLVRSDLLNAHVTAAATLAPDLPKIRGERVQLQQVLLNLVANASEAMSGEPAERRRLDISSCLDATGMVQVAVADRGHGIAEPDLERVFAPFFTTKSHGLGLGLAVCRRIIEAHGGSLWAAPADGDGGGACFRFTVPVCPGEAA